MKIEELRVGNIITHITKDGKPIQISVSAHNFWDIYAHPEWFQPIPITEEGLLKIGFERSIRSKSVYHCSKNWKIRVALNGGVYYQTQLLGSFKHIHQIQNIITDLTPE